MQRAMLILAMILSGGCGAEDDAGASEGSLDWGYRGEKGPEYWGDLLGYVECSQGAYQSPVALVSGSAAEGLPEIELDYQSSRVRIVNTGYGIRYDYDPGSKLRIEGQEYELLQFHFHAPSEHMLDGEQFPMELHLVHEGPEGSLAALGVFIVEGAENQTLVDAGSAQLPARAGEEYLDDDAMFNAAELVPAGPSYRYGGSLTIPPCMEGIAWNVFAEPITLSAQQIARFTALYSDNHRLVQSMNESDIHFGREFPWLQHDPMID